MDERKSRLSVGLSKRNRFPSIKFLGCAFAPWELPSVIKSSRQWNIRETNPDEYVVSRFGIELKLPRDYLGVLLSEWNAWETDYLPRFSLGGKVVLDVGAGAGETSMLFFRNGAKQVIAVEADPQAVLYLRQNAISNKWNVNVIEGQFQIGHLLKKPDFLKMDCEGCEEALLRAESLPPCRVEVHSRKVRNALKNRFGLRVLRRSISQDITWIMGN